MKIRPTIVPIMILLLMSTAFAADIGSDLKKQMTINAGGDAAATYSYSRLAESNILYNNDTLQVRFDATKTTAGKVNLTAQSGWWSHTLTDASDGQVLTWQGYFINGTEYWKEGENWTQLNLTDPQAVMADYNELESQVELLNYSELTVKGSEEIDGEDCTIVMVKPIPLVVKAILGTQIFASYLDSPFPLPDEFDNMDYEFENTSILDHSNVSITAWVSKNTSLLRRMQIESHLTINPSILNLIENDFTIQSTLRETTNYANFGQPVQIQMPEEKINPVYRNQGTDWRWAIFGLMEP